MILTGEDIAELRGRFYGLLALAFRYPKKCGLEELKDAESLCILDEITGLYWGSPELSANINKFKSLIASIESPEDLQVEYSRLFVGPFHLPAPPYESVYREESKGWLMGDSTIAVLQKYTDAGISVSEDFKDLPDHIMVELEFMSYLCEKEYWCWLEKNRDGGVKHYLEKQGEFLERHLNTWVPLFSKNIIEAGGHDLYMTSALLLNDFISLDMNRVKTSLIMLNG